MHARMPAVRKDHERYEIYQNCSGCKRPRTAGAAPVGRVSQASRREPARGRHAHDGDVNAGLSFDFAGSYAVAPDNGTELVDSISPPAGTLRIFLRVFAPDDLCGLRSLLSSNHDSRGRFEAAIHCYRDDRVLSDAAAGGYLNRQDGQTARRQA